MTEFDRQLWALGHIRRRQLLIALLAEQKVHIDELEITEAERRMLLVEVKHAHLPKLDDHGFIDWEPERNRVMRGPEFEEIEPLLELLHDRRDALPSGWL